jgi:hypothetical protein
MKLSAQAIALIALVVLVALVVFAGPAACNKIRSLGAQNRLTQSQLNASGQSGHDAVETVGNRQAADEAGRRTVEETKDEISKQTDAGGVTDAGRRGLCRLASHRGDAECLQHPPAR